jgi:rhamnulokinase
VTSSCAFAAVDLGAESGRVVLGRFDGRSVSLEVVHRFVNRPVRLPHALHWDLFGLFSQTLDGLSIAAVRGPLSGIGVDAWGVDYGLLDAKGALLGVPHHYRDSRTEGMIDAVHSRVPRAELYAVTGIQTMPINTVFQLMSVAQEPVTALAERIGLVPDLFGLWLSGEFANEATAASTTALLDARTGRWSLSIASALGLPRAPFSGEVVEPGTLLGPMLNLHAPVAGRGVGTPVRAVAGHDTASAFVAAPLRSPRSAILSCGTWSLLGLEVPEPSLGAEASAANMTNERGIDGTIRLLRNVMGLWLLQQCRSAWASQGAPSDYDELHRLASAAHPDAPLFDPDDKTLLSPGDAPAAIASICRATGQPAPADVGATVRSILLSLACKYRYILDRLTHLAGIEVDAIHMVGGGVRNSLLCQLTADLTGRPVIAGPEEATALGNVLVQARATGEVSGSVAELHELAAASVTTLEYEPQDQRSAAEKYNHFLAVTGLQTYALTLASSRRHP